ncbi:hypothetical protein Y032_0080g1382 [Ancylostoma ceylanicum]|uniref:Uncharacterized protein n=1 Tax=Ancylostoma ceylanicum TaxID=53326 RepID=A0A016TST3_9BILA|nr:hypothetical protein Y032_0080g1382 [Ancylostoma ceylanicum]
MDWLACSPEANPVKNVTVMDWLACSPEANPMKNIWGILVERIRAVSDIRQHKRPQGRNHLCLASFGRTSAETIGRFYA